MKKILFFAVFFAAFCGVADAGVRSGATHTARPAVTEKRVSRPNNSINARSTTQQSTSRNTNQTVTTRTPTRNVTNRDTGNVQSRQTIARAVTYGSDTVETETRTGAEYERCKAAYFTCMDQFCQLKNDNFRRCSCNNRVGELSALLDTLQSASDKLDSFNTNLDVVGMTAGQATAIVTASEGENALTKDKSSARAILQAIMNSIRGGDATVSGQYSDLNSVNISFDTVNAFGIADTGQVIATYNGQDLYSAVYPQCRSAVRADCNNASLQRAVNAYLMAIEADCNTVQAAIENKQKQLKAAVREGSAMLDLARVENRQKHNSDDLTTCVNNIENAILSEQVCGSDYHKCLDNGEFIDIATGKPIVGVANFYELQNLLRFASGVTAAEQKLSQVVANRQFVQRFETRVKKFAEPALDKCVEIADDAWSEYLDKALLSIYYAQRAKVDEIKQGCFDFVSACYISGDASITNAMSQLTDDASVVLQPNKIALNTKLCSDYIESCNNMFDENIIKSYITNRQDTDTLTACRAVAKQCFDKFGGKSYENFYHPYSGLFTPGNAMKWFTLYEDDGVTLVSECAKQIAAVDACNSPDIIKRAFGGFETVSDSAPAVRRKLPVGVATEVHNQITDTLMTQCTNLQGRFIERFLFEIKEEYRNLYHSNNLCAIVTTVNSPINKPIATGSNIKISDIYNISNDEIICPGNYSITVDTESWGICSCWENGGRRSKFGRSANCLPELPVKSFTYTQQVTCETNADCSTGYTCSTSGLCKSGNNVETVTKIGHADDAQCYIKQAGNNIGTYIKRFSGTNFSSTDWCTQTTYITNNGQICPYGYALSVDGTSCCQCTGQNNNGDTTYNCGTLTGLCFDVDDGVMKNVPVGM